MFCGARRSTRLETLPEVRAEKGLLVNVSLPEEFTPSVCREYIRAIHFDGENVFSTLSDYEVCQLLALKALLREEGATFSSPDAFATWLLDHFGEAEVQNAIRWILTR